MSRYDLFFKVFYPHTSVASWHSTLYEGWPCWVVFGCCGCPPGLTDLDFTLGGRVNGERFDTFNLDVFELVCSGFGVGETVNAPRTCAYKRC